MKNLSIIIPFLNEGVEIFNTVKNIREKAGYEVYIILINDASSDMYDYENVAIVFEAMYISHAERKGVAASRDEGVEKCLTDYFLLLDGHMRFYQTDWVDLLLSELQKDNRSLLCCQSIALEKDEKENELIVQNRRETFGAYIDFSKIGDMQAKWSTYDPDPAMSVIDIPCVLGAGYACNISYWKYLNGLKGLRSYGMDEQLMSIKVWMEGGRCKLLKKLKIGHFYREQFPYKIDDADSIYNKLYIAELLLPYEMKYNVFKKWSVEYECLFEKAVNMLIESKDDISNQKKYFNDIFENTINNFFICNGLVQSKN